MSEELIENLSGCIHEWILLNGHDYIEILNSLVIISIAALTASEDISINEMKGLTNEFSDRLFEGVKQFIDFKGFKCQKTN